MADLTLLLDIGTTTISAAILDRKRNIILASDSEINGQVRFGDDIISRIGLALKKGQNPTRLQEAAASSVNKCCLRLLTACRLTNEDIKEAFCVANTAMHHLFLGIDPSSLVTPPYKPAQKSEITIYADRTTLKLRKGCPVTFLPNIGGFIGSDALAVIVASGIYKSRAVKLVIDMGTNGEVILGNKDKILVASTAAGPAFEGRQISCGMPAIKGAIESVRIKKKGIELKVIGGGSPKGIAGSGLIDTASQLLKAGIMNASGKIKGSEFILYKKQKLKISVTQQDIRKIQLAKAAIYAAVRLLIRKSDIPQTAIKKVLITGTFGNIINPESILSIGLVPKIEKADIEFLKQGTLEGLRLYLGEPSLENKLISILSKIRHIPLLGRDFAREFTSSLVMKD